MLRNPLSAIVVRPVQPSALAGALALLMLAVTTTAPVLAQTWTGSGPPGADITALVADPSAPGTLFAGTAFDGVFRSTDSGTTWAAVNTGLGNTTVFGLAVKPDTAGTVYAATNDGVYKTTNAGTSWASANTGLTATGITAIAVDPTSTGKVYAGASENGRGGVFRSTNGGTSWTAINSADLNIAKTIRVLAVDPLSGAVYAGTAGKGIFKTPNGGTTWAVVNNGLSNKFVMALAPHPVEPNVIYAGTLGSGIYVSTNGGGQWANVSNGIGNQRIAALMVDPEAEQSSLEKPDPAATLYAGTLGGGMFRSEDSSNSWTQVNTGLIGNNVAAVVFDATDSSVAYAGMSGGGVFTTTDGSTWSAASAGLPGARISSLAIDPATPTRVFASTHGAGVFASADGATTWTPAGTGFTSFSVGNLAVDPVDPNQVFATSGEVYGSSDGGTNWAIISSGVRASTALAIDPVGGQILYAGTGNEGVFRSPDGGVSWSAVNNGLTRTQVSALALDPTNPAIVYVGTGGVSKTIDSGANWNPTGLADVTVSALAVAPSAPSTVYAATRVDGLFRSIDSGTTWTSTNTGLPAGDILALAIDPTDADRVYAGTPFGGVFFSDNGGANWSALNNGLPTRDISALAATAGGAPTYAGTRGVFVLSSSASCGLTFTCLPCEQCDIATDSCVARQRTGCIRPLIAGKSQLQIKRGRKDTSNQIAWSWKKGPAIDVADFGDPTTATGYTFCVFDESGAEPVVIFGAEAPAGGTCGRRDCWAGRGRPRGSRGFKYSDRERTPDGLATIELKPGDAGRARLTVKGRGANLLLPALPVSIPLVGQLWADGEGCWESEILPGGVKRNDEKQLRGKAGIP